jgi:hypothetical protein
MLVSMRKCDNAGKYFPMLYVLNKHFSTISNTEDVFISFAAETSLADSSLFSKVHSSQTKPQAYLLALMPSTCISPIKKMESFLM